MSKQQKEFTQKKVFDALKERNNIMYQYLKKKGLLTAYANSLLHTSTRPNGEPDIALFNYRIKIVFENDAHEVGCNSIWSCIGMLECQVFIPSKKNTTWYKIAEEISLLKKKTNEQSNNES